LLSSIEGKENLQCGRNDHIVNFGSWGLPYLFGDGTHINLERLVTNMRHAS